MSELSPIPLVEITFTSTRPNTNTAFWWESTDTAIVAAKNEILRIAEEYSVPAEFQVVNSLTATQTYRVFNAAQWSDTFLPALQAALPNLLTERNQYYTNAGHSLTFKMVDTKTSQVISQLTLI